MKTYFIADLHLGHINCLSYDNRPFMDIETHDKEIVRRWNDKVDEDDTVWILGDFSWLDSVNTCKIFKQLKGHKNLCVGNHDHKLLKQKSIRDLFEEIVDYKEIWYDKDSTVPGLVLCHYPIPCFNHHYHNWVHLYGHVHSSFEWNMMERVKFEMTDLYEKPCRMYNVGAMMSYINYTPQSLEEILSITEGSV